VCAWRSAGTARAARPMSWQRRQAPHILQCTPRRALTALAAACMAGLAWHCTAVPWLLAPRVRSHQPAQATADASAADLARERLARVACVAWRRTDLCSPLGCGSLWPKAEVQTASSEGKVCLSTALGCAAKPSLGVVGSSREDTGRARPSSWERRTRALTCAAVRRVRRPAEDQPCAAWISAGPGYCECSGGHTVQRCGMPALLSVEAPVVVPCLVVFRQCTMQCMPVQMQK